MFSNVEITWILTREIKPDPSVLRTAMDVLSRNGLGRTSMIPTSHTSCKYDWVYYLKSTEISLIF